MNSNFARFLCVELTGQKQSSAAANMGITPSQLNKAMKGCGCERTTLAKIFAGISTNIETRAQCVQAYLQDILELAGESVAAHIEVSIREPETAGR